MIELPYINLSLFSGAKLVILFEITIKYYAVNQRFKVQIEGICQFS